MEELKRIKDTLMGCVQGQMGHLESVDAKELGEVVDMIKDISEAIYYCTITEAMEEKDEKGKEHHYYTERHIPMDYRDMDKDRGRMYFDETMYYSDWRSPKYNKEQPGGMMWYGNGNDSSANGNGSSRYYTEREFPMEMMRDEREGKSPMSRKSYMESKEMQHDKNIKLKELEKYMQELTTDMVEMIQGASPEEK